MDVYNHTSFPHLLFRTGLENNKMAAAVILRATYDLVDGTPRPSENQAWPLSASPWQSPYGPMEGDFVFKRGGVDVFIFGSARTPKKQAAKKMDVRVILPGKIDYKITVFGDRIWESGFGGLRMSDPKPFTEMPLTLANAYGGWGEWDKLKFSNPNNPSGKGFIWEKEGASGKQLPNIEDPKNLITRWNDRPLPAGLTAAPVCEQRLKKAVEFDSEGTLVKLDPLFYNAAFPELVAPEIAPGETITVYGVNPSGPFQFTVPDQKLYADISFGDKTERRSLYIDQIGLEPDKNRAFITYRYAFNYFLNPMTKRIIHIVN
ncbi:MAG: DUF2169 domain-containing protein [Chitinophagaceae bacterium]